jgi:uncharacterized flavoprotein (TIGR03862 family)
MAAEALAAEGVAVTVYDHMPTPGRKFLMAGRGGLNLTHSEDLPHFLSRYGKAGPYLGPAIEAFPPSALIAWCESLGQPTFVGTSGRVFPCAMKASPLLRAWLARLSSLNVAFRPRHRWSGWDEEGRLQFKTPDGRIAVETSATILALGGASWPRLGSDGHWTTIFAEAGIAVSPLKPSNCGFAADFSDLFRERFEGHPLKGAEFSFGGERVRGEAVVTRIGLEGGAIYALSSRLRNAIERDGGAIITIDLRPGIDAGNLEASLSRPREKQSLSNVLRRTAKLAPVAVGLLHEAARQEGKHLASAMPAELGSLIRNLPVRLTAAAPIERAISTAGGVAFEELDGSFMLRKKPGVFIAGEMVDWEAPTGGYLLQGCFSTGIAAARGALAWLNMIPGD